MKLAIKVFGLSISRFFPMSRMTLGVAVAVSYAHRIRKKFSGFGNFPIFRPGKSCPHSDMQWASSIAMASTFAEESISMVSA